MQIRFFVAKLKSDNASKRKLVLKKKEKRNMFWTEFLHIDFPMRSSGEHEGDPLPNMRKVLLSYSSSIIC